MKVNIITSRYGKDVTGGAEKHCHDIVNILPNDWEIHIHTTTAKDYISWKNEFKPGISKYGHITIHRHIVDYPRKINRFNAFTDSLRKIYPNQDLEKEWEWIRMQGPFSSSLCNAILSREFQADANIYFSYLYHPTVYGILNSSNTSIIVPMLHDEFPAYLNLYKSVFSDKLIYAFNSPEEIDLFRKIYGFRPSRSYLIGTYVDLYSMKQVNSTQKLNSTNSNSEYILTIGRMDAGKGIPELIEDFAEWRHRSGENLELWVAGKNPEAFQRKHPYAFVKFLGQISEDEKSQFILGSRAVINPSSMESFSILIMESWAHSRPVIANARSEVTMGHCKRSNGGLYYKDKQSLFAILDMLMTDVSLFDRMGMNGREYVKKNFLKDRIADKWNQLIRTTLS